MENQFFLNTKSLEAIQQAINDAAIQNKKFVGLVFSTENGTATVTAVESTLIARSTSIAEYTPINNSKFNMCPYPPPCHILLKDENLFVGGIDFDKAGDCYK